MTSKQQNLINELKKSGEVFVDVLLSFKETPEVVESHMVKLIPFDENDHLDKENDDNVFFYFNGVDGLIDAMDSGNENYDFTILGIDRIYDYGIAYDRNGFQIKRGDRVFLTDGNGVTTCDWTVYGDPDGEYVSLQKDNYATISDAIPNNCEIDTDLISVSVNDIEWDCDDKSVNLPSHTTIELTYLIEEYGLCDFSKIDQAIFDYLSGEYDYCANSLTFELNRLMKQSEKI